MDDGQNDGDTPDTEYGSIVSEIAASRRYERSLKRRSSSIRKATLITDLPSRNIVFKEVTDEADDVVQHLEQGSDDTPKSVKERLNTLRELPKSLPIKRQVRDSLKQAAKKRSFGKPPSCWTRSGYMITYSFLHMVDVLKSTKTRLEPWYYLLKNIEGHFGSGVATYFKFLRSLLLINLVVFVISLLFIIIPQLIHVNLQTGEVSVEPPGFRFGNLFTGDGYLRESVLFYGYYSNTTIDITGGYNMPNAYFFSSLLCYFIVFLLLSISMAVSFRRNFIEGADGARQNVFANKIFGGWDFGIATKNAADLKAKSTRTELRELLDEQRVSEKSRSWFSFVYTLIMQVALNLLLAGILAVSAYFSWHFLKENARDSHPQTNMMVSLVLTIIVHIGPVLLSLVLRIEEYESPRSATYVTLVRTFVLDAVVIVVAVAHRLGVAEETNSCWETALGQEIYRLVLLDTLIGLIGTSLAQFVRYRLSLTLWKGIGCPEMDVARNTINLLYNQTLLYVGLYFSPLLSLVIVLKLLLTLYVKYWCALHHCQPSARMWRAAQTQTIFLTSAFIAFFGVLILYGYILSSVHTSQCGPFRGNKLTYDAVVSTLTTGDESSTVFKVLLYVRKPGVVAVLLVTMFLGAYYLRAVGKSRARVLRILQDVLQLQAKDKEYLLNIFSRYQKAKSSGLEPITPREYGDAIIDRKSTDIAFTRSQQDIRASNPNLMRVKKSPHKAQSLLDLFHQTSTSSSLLLVEREFSDEAHNVPQLPKASFNPIFVESPVPPDRATEGRSMSNYNHDDKVPSRMGYSDQNRV